MEGGILQDWAAKQQEYYDWLQKRNTGKRWITTLIKKLREISWNMWKQRNGELKNPTSPANLRDHARLDADITIEYQDLITLTQWDRCWLRRPKEVMFTEPLEYKQQRLEPVRLACSRYERISFSAISLIPTSITPHAPPTGYRPSNGTAHSEPCPLLPSPSPNSYVTTVQSSPLFATPVNRWP
jgi:hypothetical protein